jgi:hypothetical protein
VCVDMLDAECREALKSRQTQVLDETPRCTRDVLVDGTWQRCSRHVEHYRRADGTTAFRESGACATCGRKEREQQRMEAAS